MSVEKRRKRFLRKPRVLTQRYLDKMQSELGITSGQQYRMPRDYSKKLLTVFGKFRGLWCAHHAVSEILQLHLQGQHDHVGAYLCLLAQSMHQSCIDQGDWSTAVMILPTEDPLNRTPFGADERQLAEIYSYRKAIRELKSTGWKAAKTDGAEEDSTATPNEGGKGGGKHKKKDK